MLLVFCALQLCVSDSGTLEVITQGKVGTANSLPDGTAAKAADGEHKQAAKPSPDPLPGLRRSFIKVPCLCLTLLLYHER